MCTMLNDKAAGKAFLESVESAVVEARQTGVCSDQTWLLESVLKLRNLEVDKTQQINVNLQLVDEKVVAAMHFSNNIMQVFYPRNGS